MLDNFPLIFYIYNFADNSFKLAVNLRKSFTDIDNFVDIGNMLIYRLSITFPIISSKRLKIVVKAANQCQQIHFEKKMHKKCAKLLILCIIIIESE